MHLAWLDPAGGCLMGERKQQHEITGRGVVKNELLVVGEVKRLGMGSTRD